MPKNTNGLRMAVKHKWLNTNKVTRASFQNRAYYFNTLPKNVTAQTEFKKFKKELNR